MRLPQIVVLDLLDLLPWAVEPRLKGPVGRVIDGLIGGEAHAFDCAIGLQYIS